MSNASQNGSVPDAGVVQRCTRVYPQLIGGRERRDVVIGLRLSRRMIERVEEYQARCHKNNRTEALVDLVDLGLFVMDNLENLERPEIVQSLRQNLYNIQLVDDIMSWPQDRIEALLAVLASERDRRIRLRIGRI